jgi:hypothetical protein
MFHAKLKLSKMDKLGGVGNPGVRKDQPDFVQFLFDTDLRGGCRGHFSA